MPSWGWDNSVKRYRNIETGHFMPRTTVLGYVEQSIKASTVAAGQLAGFVGEKALSPKDFAAFFKEEVKREYVRQYLLGAGGREQMTASDWGKIGNMVKEQYKYLKGFEKDLATKEMTPEQIAARAEMYINSAREAYETAHKQNASELGLTEELWVLGVAEHCEDCLGFAGQGWQPAGTFPTPGAGATQCLTNCQCHKAYRNPATGQTL